MVDGSGCRARGRLNHQQSTIKLSTTFPHGSIFPRSSSNPGSMRDQSILDNVRIASPCHARWEDMVGDDRARFCGQCRKNVYNFSAMTRAEVETLIRDKEGRLCGRFYRRPDGRMLTADCPTGVQRKRNRLMRICGVVAGFMVFLLGGCTRRPTQGMVMGDVVYPQPAPTNTPPALLGEVMVTPKEEPKILPPASTGPSTGQSTNR